MAVSAIPSTPAEQVQRAATLTNVLYEKKGAIAYVTLNRPKVLNALSQGAWQDLRTAFEQARDDAAVLGVILTGTGDKAFIAGEPGVDVRVVDESGKDVPSGQPGELVARGANVMHGYWNSPEQTQLAFRDGMFRTGDIGYQDADGFVYILDRLKDMIVTGGENVYSAKFEAIIFQHPAVRETAVFGIPDPQWGELVMACVVLKSGATASVDELTTHCRRFLAGYKIPRRIEFSPGELPKSGSGKILKRALRERFWAHQERAVS